MSKSLERGWSRLPFSIATPLGGRAIRTLLLAALAAYAGGLAAEGSRSLFPSGYTSSRAPMDLQNNATTAGVARNRQFIYVYAQAGEYIILGSSNRDGGSPGRGNISVYDPQGFGPLGIEIDPPSASYTCNAGALAATGTLAETFDAGAFPSTWRAYNLLGTNLWASTAGDTQAGAGKASVTVPATISDAMLQGPVMNVGAGTPRTVSFFRSHTLPAGNTDGMVLEVSVNGAPFQDATSLAGSGLTNGYTGTIASGSGNPLSGRQAWANDSGGYIQSVYTLPAALAAGTRVQFRWRFATNNANPAGTFFMRLDTVTVANLTTPAAAAGPHFSSDTLGRITTRANELAGPRSADNSAGGANTWAPCAYRAPVSGIYGVRFTGSTNGVSGITTVTDIATNPQILQDYAAAWEVQVRADASTTTDINGRVHTYAWMGRTAASGVVGHSLYYITADGYRYIQTLKDINPITYALWGNRAGFFNSDGVSPLYKDIRGNNINVTTLLPVAANFTAQRPEFPVFFSDVSDAGPNDAEVELVLSALGISDVPPTPEISGVSFTGNVSGSTTTFGTGGTFTFSTVNTLTYQIVVSRDGVDFNPANPLNRVLTGVALTGTHNVIWNGLDNAGNQFPVGNGYQFRVDGRNGEIHLPLVDNEAMLDGGFRLEKLNGPDVGTAAARTVYYDDRGYVAGNGTPVGELNGHLCGAGNLQQQPSPVVSLEGIDSGTTYRVYLGTADSNTDCNSSAASAFGSAKILETWALQLTPIVPGELNIVPAGSQPSLSLIKEGEPGPIDVSNATSTTYTLTVTNSGTGDTSGDIVIHDELRAGLSLTGFVGANWNCVGPTSVVCTYTGPALAAGGGSTSVEITVSIAQFTVDANNTARVSGGGDPVCLPPPAALSPENTLLCSPTIIIGTVPVTLSFVQSSISNGQLNVLFTTLAEAGTAGFRVLVGHPGQSERRPVGAMLSSQGSGLAPQDYVLQVPYDDGSAIWIEEVTSDGLSTIYGPYPIGSETGQRVAGDLIDWAGIRAEQRSFRSAQIAAIRGRASGSALEAELRAASSGLMRISHEQLQAEGIDWSGVDPRHIELTQGSEVLSMQYSGPPLFGSGSAFQFLAQAIEGSLYTQTAVYRMRVRPQLAASAMQSVHANPVGLEPVLSVRDWMLHAPNRSYDLSARSLDPYSAFRLFRNGASPVSRSEVFLLPDLDLSAGTAVKGGPSTSDRIEVELWSDFDFPHSLRFVLNGSEIGRTQFIGRAQHVFATELPAGLLLNGSNSLLVELLPDTGRDLDSVNLEAIRVNYARRLLASGNALSFELGPEAASQTSSESIFASNFSAEGSPACQPLDACSAYRVGGLSSSDVTVLRQRDGQVQRLSQVRFSGPVGAHELEFASSVRAGDRYWIEPAAGRVAAELAPALAITDPLAGGPADYLIVSHGSMISGLAPLVAARQAEGLSVRVVDVQDLYHHYGNGSVDPAAIRAAVIDARQRLNATYVLLVGGDTRDYFNYSGSNSVSFIPTYYRQVGAVVTYAPTDVPYADVDGDGAVDLALGRWPVRTAAELAIVVDKTLAYAQADHAGRSVAVSDRNQGDVNFGVQLQLLPMGLGSPWANTSIRLQDYPANGTAAARADLVNAINAGQSLLVFMGHGAPLAWTQEGLVTSQLLIDGLFNNPTRPTVAWAVGCYGTYFTQPSYNSVAHGLMTRNPSGAAAVFGASTLSEIANDIVWLNALSPAIRGPRLGDSLRSVQNRLHEAGEDYKDIWLGVSLLGDPALKLRD